MRYKITYDVLSGNVVDIQESNTQEAFEMLTEEQANGFRNGDIQLRFEQGAIRVINEKILVEERKAEFCKDESNGK